MLLKKQFKVVSDVLRDHAVFNLKLNGSLPRLRNYSWMTSCLKNKVIATVFMKSKMTLKIMMKL